MNQPQSGGAPPPPPPPQAPKPAGWFPDPLGRHEHRWFNGTTWTADVSNGGNRLIDPYGASAGPGDGRGNGVAVAAMVCGIIAVLLAWMPILVVAGFVLAVLALVFGIRGQRRAKTAGKGSGPAIAGIVTGSVGLALSVVGVVLTVLTIREIVDFTEPGPVSAEVVSCELTGSTVEIEARLRNDSREVRDYTVFGLIRSPDDEDGDLFAQVYDVEPGETVDFEMSRSRFGEEGPCEARLVVQGPFPFGIEIDRTNDFN